MDGQKTWTLLSEDKQVEGHLRSQSLEIQAEASNCITDHCVAVGRLIYSKFATKPTRSIRSADWKKCFDHSEKRRLIFDKSDYCPYESNNRQVLIIDDKRYDDGYTSVDYINEWLVTWNSYARFAGYVIDFQNRTAFDVL